MVVYSPTYRLSCARQSDKNRAFGPLRLWYRGTADDPLRQNPIRRNATMTKLPYDKNVLSWCSFGVRDRGFVVGGFCGRGSFVVGRSVVGFLSRTRHHAICLWSNKAIVFLQFQLDLVETVYTLLCTCGLLLGYCRLLGRRTRRQMLRGTGPG